MLELAQPPVICTPYFKLQVVTHALTTPLTIMLQSLDQPTKVLLHSLRKHLLSYILQQAEIHWLSVWYVLKMMLPSLDLLLLPLVVLKELPTTKLLWLERMHALLTTWMPSSISFKNTTGYSQLFLFALVCPSASWEESSSRALCSLLESWSLSPS